ncbi:MAG: 3'-5' exonuclease, partial [Halovenus sp.]
MSEGEQTGLAAFGEGGTDRPEAEAAAVAGGESVAADVVDAEEFRYPDAEGTIEISVTQVDYTIEGSGDDEYPVVHVFGRTPGERELVHVEVYEFRPYFYAPTVNLDFDDLRSRDRITGWETGYESIRREELTKIFGQTPRDVGQIRDEFEHYEADILFPNRLLIDKDITSGVRVPERRTENGPIRIPHDEVKPADIDAEPRISTFDIEVDDRSGFPEDGEEPIICIASHDSYRDEYLLWLYDAGEGGVVPDRLDGYDPLEGDFEADIRVFDEEPAMLDAFVSYMEDESDPDIITGWNCLPEDADVQMADGQDKAIQNIEIGDRVVGSESQHVTIGRVTNKWKSETDILEFELADGTSLRTSGDHRIMVGDANTVEWTDGQDVEPGDYVLKPRKLRVESSTVPELSDLVPLENQRFADEDVVKEFKSELPYSAVTELAAQFGITKGTLHYPKTDVWTPERCRIAAAEYDIPVPDGGCENRRSRTRLDRELTKEESYLAGLILAGGSMSPEDGLRFYNTREELHEQFPGRNNLEPDGKGCYKQNVLDWARMHAFNGLGIPFGNKNETEVDLSTVYEMPESYIGRFLAGAVDGDGNVSSTLTVAAKNRTIGEWYVKLFRRLGIYAEQRAHVVRVPGTERDLERLEQSVVPHMNHSEKVDRLRALEGGTSNRAENIPFALFEAERGSDERRIGRDKHRRGINLKRHETELEEWEEYVFVEVNSVEANGTQTTFDIETTTDNFFAEDCLVHNCDDFDVPYLLDRLDRVDPTTDCDLDIDRLSRVNEVWRSDWQGPDIKGRVVFDLLRAYKRTQFTELESYRLEAVGEEELGAGKETYTGDIGDLWENDPERLLEYNLRDVELCVELDRKQDIIAFFEEIASFVGCKLEDAPTPGDAVDMYVLHKAHGRFVLPSKGTVESGEEFEGGAVFDPITGVKEMVSVLDLKCFSGDTDVMTPNGPRRITDFDVGDEVYTLNPETFECEVKPVIDTQSYDNKYGELHHLSGNTYDFKITENHRLLASAERGWDEQTPSDFQFSEYRDIPENERFAFPQHESMGGDRPEQFDLVDDLEGGHVVVYYEDDLRSFRNRMPNDLTDQIELVHGSSEQMGIQKKIGKY